MHRKIDPRYFNEKQALIITHISIVIYHLWCNRQDMSKKTMKNFFESFWFCVETNFSIKIPTIVLEKMRSGDWNNERWTETMTDG